MAGGRDLRGIADSILASFVARLGGLGASVPARCYVAPGSMIPWDGEQLVVNLQSIDQGIPGQPIGIGYFDVNALQLTATFTVSLLRSVNALEQQNPLVAMVPSAADIDTEGGVAMDDASYLIQAGVEAWTSGDFSNGGGGNFVIGPCNTIGPEGGLSGNRLTLTFALL